MVWYGNKANTEKREKLQHRALKITFIDFMPSYNNLLHKANNMSTLHLSRLMEPAVKTLKCAYKISPSYVHALVYLKNDTYCFRCVKTRVTIC